MILTLDLDEITKLLKEGSSLALDPEAEKSIARLMAIQEQIDDFVGKMKAKIMENALAKDENFTGMKGDHLKVELRAYGATYKMPDHTVVADEFKTVRVSASVNSKAVDKYLQDTGSLPEGIERAERNKQLTIKKVA